MKAERTVIFRILSNCLTASVTETFLWLMISRPSHLFSCFSFAHPLSLVRWSTLPGPCSSYGIITYNIIIMSCFLLRMDYIRGTLLTILHTLQCSVMFYGLNGHVSQFVTNSTIYPYCPSIIDDRVCFYSFILKRDFVRTTNYMVIVCIYHVSFLGLL